MGSRTPLSLAPLLFKRPASYSPVTSNILLIDYIPQLLTSTHHRNVRESNLPLLPATCTVPSLLPELQPLKLPTINGM